MQTSDLPGLLARWCRKGIDELTDRELVETLVTRRDESAFEALLERYGRMVFAVCRRVLNNQQDAEDAYQATFLVLLRKASSIRRREAVASWLHGVAYHTARKARTMTVQRRNKEARAAVRTHTAAPEANDELDAAILALPERYRLPVILCELEGKSRREAAKHLRIPEGTLSSRLAAARKILAKRLRDGDSKRSADVSPSIVLPGVPGLLEAAASVLGGREIPSILSPRVSQLSQVVIKAMFLNKLRLLSVALIAVVAIGTAGPGRSQPTDREGPPAERGPTTRSSANALLLAAKLDLQNAENLRSRAEVNLRAANAQVVEATQRLALIERGSVATDKREVGMVMATIASQFKYRIPFEIGRTRTREGGRVDILDVWGTEPDIRVGGQYIVHGKYALKSFDKGMLYFHESTNGPSGIGSEIDLQFMGATIGEHEFTLLHAMRDPGYFHLTLIGATYSDWLADVYFGTGENVMRDR